MAVQNERVVDLETTAGREPIDCNYEASFDSNGIVNSCSLDLTLICGAAVADCAGDGTMAVQFRCAAMR